MEYRDADSRSSRILGLGREVTEQRNSAATGVLYGVICGLIFWGIAIVALYFYLTGGTG